MAAAAAFFGKAVVAVAVVLALAVVVLNAHEIVPATGIDYFLAIFDQYYCHHGAPAM